MPAGEPAERLGEESSRLCALEQHPPAEPQNPVLASSGSVGRPWKLAPRGAAMWSGLESPEFKDSERHIMCIASYQDAEQAAGVGIAGSDI